MNDAQYQATTQLVSTLRKMREAMRARLEGTPLLPMALEGYDAKIHELEDEIAEHEVLVCRGEWQRVTAERMEDVLFGNQAREDRE